MSDLMNQSIHHEAVCRTALATPGLLITEVSTEHQKWPKISTNSIRSSFFARRAKKPRPKGEALRRS